MAWTATIYRVDDEASAERYGIEPRILGGTEAIWRRLRRVLPDLYCQGWEAWLVGDGWRMQFSLWSRMAPALRSGVDSIQVEVVGDGDPLGVLVTLCQKHDWCLFDDETGCFVDLEDPAGSSWSSGPAPDVPKRRSLAMMLVPESLRRDWREVVLYDLDGAPERDGQGLFRRFPLGRAEDVRERIDAALPDTVWSGRRGRADLGSSRLLFHLKDRGLVDTMRIWAAGPDADEWIHALCEPTGWSAWEPASDTFGFLHATSQEAVVQQLVERYPGNVIAFPSR